MHTTTLMISLYWDLSYLSEFDRSRSPTLISLTGSSFSILSNFPFKKRICFLSECYQCDSSALIFPLFLFAVSSSLLSTSLFWSNCNSFIFSNGELIHSLHNCIYWLLCQAFTSVTFYPVCTFSVIQCLFIGPQAVFIEVISQNQTLLITNVKFSFICQNRYAWTFSVQLRTNTHTYFFLFSVEDACWDLTCFSGTARLGSTGRSANVPPVICPSYFNTASV